MNAFTPVAQDLAVSDRLPLADALAALAVEANQHDCNGADPAALVRPLVEAGVFRDVLPEPFGAGLATEASKVAGLHDLLRRVGGANLSAGRLFEGHVNAVKLVFAFGDERQRAEVRDGVLAGDLMGVWNAEAPPGVRLESKAGRLVLQGSKIYASGVGLLRRPLITARDVDGAVQITAPKAAGTAPFDLSGWRMRGMRATATGTIHLDGVSVEDHEKIGAPGDYYRSPGFRGGAWRFATVQFGAVEEIARLMTQGLKARGRAADAHQRARLGQAEIAVQTARLWTRHAADVVEGGVCSPADADACAGMARLVVERAALDVTALAERALGLMAFCEAEPIERIVRDLSTYLRQPFPDAVLDGIGEWALQR
jgi:alkylation response protein AidB-like acyl-CoA dehydrogenase